MSRYAPLPPDTFDRLSGLDTLRAMIAGDLPAPPMAGTLNFDLIEAEGGRVVFAGTPLEAHLNPAGTVHGGWAATILDSALACAVHATLAVGERYTSVEMKLNYLRPILAGKTGRLTCEGKVIQRGRTLALSEARLVDSGGKLYAHASETCMIFPKA
ncbi:PaaI family thioesterase [Rhabdaerophilum sp. SD176]|uniref:PaaI family thioesterase n=1 Tax=Rhabdaerophilum sp. SD176 TaxID=2983548 RepID=UPI0024DF5944|nr:PaaI family thioesterase [Rhabdaerophilum sp. SD176]